MTSTLSHLHSNASDPDGDKNDIRALPNTFAMFIEIIAGIKPIMQLIDLARFIESVAILALCYMCLIEYDSVNWSTMIIFLFTLNLTKSTVASSVRAKKSTKTGRVVFRMAESKPLHALVSLAVVWTALLLEVSLKLLTQLEIFVLQLSDNYIHPDGSRILFWSCTFFVLSKVVFKNPKF